MADEDDDDLEFEPADAGVAFRAEMAATNFALGYWRHIVAVLVVVLLGFLFYGQYQSWHLGDQRDSARQIFEAERALRDAEDPQPELFGQVADALMAVDARGMAKSEALLKAAELYRLAEQPEKQRSTLELAAGASEGVLAYAADAAIANLDLEAGDGDAATARLRRLMDSEQGFLAQQAALDLALMYEHLDRTADARAVYDEFTARFPESELGDEVRERRAKLGDG